MKSVRYVCSFYNKRKPHCQVQLIENLNEIKYPIPFVLFAADVISFYQTPVDTILPLDALKTADLPENIHIEHNYVRFHPDTDTKFGGQTAFPKSSTIISGLRCKKKYKGFEAKTSWPWTRPFVLL